MRVAGRLLCVRPRRGEGIVTLGFTHATGPFHISGIRGPASSVTSILTAESSAGNLVAVDLTLGAWRMRHAAADMYAQLGLEARWEAPASNPAHSLFPVSRVGNGIDRE